VRKEPTCGVKEKEIEAKITRPFEQMDDFKRQIEMISNFSGSPIILEIDHLSDRF
jgi:hypothetical protein